MESAAESTTLDWVVHYWGWLTAGGSGLVAFLIWYDSVRRNGQLFVCDVARLFGLGNTFPMCRKAVETANDTDLLTQINWLEQNQDHLTMEQREQLPNLKRRFAERVFANLQKVPGLEETPLDARAAADTRHEVRETVEEGDPAERKALAMIAEGDVNGGLERLVAHASVPTQETAAHWRRIARLAYPADTALAVEAIRKVIALEPSDHLGGIYLGRLFERAGDLNAARDAYSQTLDQLPYDEARTRMVVLGGLGDVQMAQGDSAGALKSFRAALEIAERLAAQNPGQTKLQRDLSVCHIKIGEVLRFQSNFTDALQSYQASLDILKSLAEQDSANDEWQRDLSLNHEKIGDVQLAQGDLAGARKSYCERFNVLKRLATDDPTNTELQRDLSVGHEKIGDVLLDEGDIAGSLKSHEASLEIRKQLVEQDPANAVWQRDVSISHERIGVILQAQGDLVGALENFREHHRIAERLAAKDQQNARWQCDFASSLWRLAEITESGVTWREVVRVWEGLDKRGFLTSEQRQYLREARRRAEQVAED